MSSLFNAMMGAAGVSTGGYEVDNSAVFDRGSNQYLNFTPSGAGNRDIWTLSMWVKRGTLGTDQFLFSAGADASNFTGLSFTTSDTLRYEHQDGGSRTDEVIPDMLFRDPHAFYHIVCAVDTTSGTEAHRVRLYINGVEESLSGTPNYPGQNVDTDVNQADEHRFGSRVTDGADDADVYLSQIAFIDGSQKQATDFGEYSDSVWRPVDVSASISDFGTNGFYLDFADSSNLGNDVSGNNNDFTNNSAVSQSNESPSKNFAVLTPLVVGNGTATFSQGNLKVVQSGGGNLNTFGSVPLKSGKWHFEVTLTNTVDQFGLGIIPVGNVTGNTNQFFNLGIGAMISGSSDGNVYNNGSNVATITGGSGADGQTLSCEIDLDNDQLEWFNNAGSSLGTYSFTPTTANGGRYLPCVHCNDDATYVVNFGASTFSKTPSTGFTGISAALLNAASAPAIGDGTTDFVVALDTEANIAATLASARSGFTNYLDLLVNRSTGENRLWRFSHDSTKEHAQAASSTYQSTSTLSGSDNWIGLSWKVGGTAKIRAGSASHTNGSDTTVSFTTVGTTRYWAMIFERGSSKPVTFRHPDMDSGKLANFCNQTNPATDDRIHTFAATSFVIDADEATNTYDYIVWPEIAGFCSLFKFACASSGPLILMDISPKASFLRANSGGVSNTWLTDNVRQTYNVQTIGTAMDGANAEAAMSDQDYLANGIKLREASDVNEETDSIGISWADHPFAGTTPATAR